MYKLTLLLLACIGQCTFLSGQQQERFLEIRGHAELELNPLGSATATLYDGNTRVSSVQTGNDGSFTFKLEANKLYTIEVSKDGLVAKRISFNTAIPDEESGLWVREFAIGLIVPCEGVDYAPLQKPVDIIKFNARRRDFESDKDYVEGRMPELEEIYIKSANCLSDKYDRLIRQADKQFGQKTYEEARKTYQQALDIMPKEAYPKKKIAEIDALLAKQKDAEDQYDETIKKADALMAQQQYAEALNQYKAAAVLNPQETYSAKKINEIQALLAKQQAEKQAAASAEAQYNDLIAKAGQAYDQKNYEAAKKYYQDALSIKPSESTPRSRIQEIDALIKNQQQQRAQQKSVDDAYQAAVAEADALYKAKKYDAAKEAYAKALAIKPSESYPRTRTQEIDKAIEEQAIAEQSARSAELSRNLESYLDEGDSQYKAKNYEAARVAYAKALEIKPNEGYARQRINTIDKLLANEQAAIEKAQAEEQAAREKALADEKAAREQALAAEQAAKEKALAEQAAREKALAAEQSARQKAIDDGYKNAITMGNTAQAQKQYNAALEQYQKALTFKPDDAFAKNKITEVNNLIDEENKNLAAAEARNKQYQNAIASADKLYQVKDFTGAISSYRNALVIRPGDAYAQQRITGIENALAAEQAAKQKAAEAEQAAKQKAVEEGYNNAIALANAALAQKQYNPAKEQYQKALTFKPDDSFARNRITEIDLLIKQEQERLSAEQARKRQYDEAVQRADKLFASQDYNNARLAFGDASRVMPDEPYPKQKMSEIDRILGEQQKALAEKQAKDKAYDEAVKNGDNFFSLKNYNDAKQEYNKALSVKPGEAYPRNKITEIDNLIKAEQKAMADAKAREDAYNSAVSSGNNAYGQRLYAEAKGFYGQALKIKPNDAYAKDQIQLIDNLLAEQEKQRMAEQAKQKQYDDLISLADKAFDGNNYTVAKEYYLKAMEVIPGSPYPKQKIARIDEINKLLAQQRTKNTQQTAAKTSGSQSLASAAPLTQLNFKNDQERDVYLDDLKKKYPEGVTVEVYKEKYRETKRYIVVRDNLANEYRDVLIKTYGGHEYTLNGRAVTQMYFESQVKSREGEYYKETIFE